ncbi:hypothetical protein JHJ32_06835 [Parapedobacter sp. ISTM3]|uniref:hypothetical protein n=1 Tax=Parapedobacter sp. ISTM3 TaxID=2800130 RepID=UPI0019088C8D|nr:hypothetical protein [Parapedobacter sp. ISTM3]MBK1439692.1 hypothetical protein [Parapedobacter sp. ISTM3]
MRKQVILALSFVLGLSILTASFAFTFRPAAQNTWHYTGSNDPLQFNQAENWEPGESPSTCDGAPVLPCQMNNVNAADRTQLQQILDDYPEEEIFEIASGKSS